MLWPQGNSDRRRLRKYLARSCLADLRFDKIVHGKDYFKYLLFVCSLRSLPSSQAAILAQPHPHCSLRHKGAGAGSTSSSAVSLTTNDMESRAAQALATTTDWQSNGVSNRRSMRRLETGDFPGHVQRRVAPSDRPLRAGGRGDR